MVVTVLESKYNSVGFGLIAITHVSVIYVFPPVDIDNEFYLFRACEVCEVGLNLVVSPFLSRSCAKF